MENQQKSNSTTPDDEVDDNLSQNININLTINLVEESKIPSSSLDTGKFLAVYLKLIIHFCYYFIT